MNQVNQRSISELFDLAGKNRVDMANFQTVLDNIDSSDTDHQTIHHFLECFHLPAVNRIIVENQATDYWFDKITHLIQKSRYHVGHLIKQRTSRYGEKPLFLTIEGESVIPVSYNKVWHDVIQIGRALDMLSEEEMEPVIGLLSYNQYRCALLDLACLSFGFRVVPIPLNTTIEHLSHILHEAEITHLFIGGEKGARLWNAIFKGYDLAIIDLNEINSLKGQITSWETFRDLSDKNEKFDLNHRLESQDMTWPLTIMYTSGSTDQPKGVIFNQVNLMSKRFARAMALPEFSSSDTFLCYLPLFHTFGRYFELLGSIFWGATYAFAESPAFNSLLKDFQLVSPSIFISIPKRWIQLYEYLEEKLELDSTSDTIICQKLMDITGGKLQWGLSAAGYLDPDFFKFFQEHGIQLLSGYGMTEATGGITMTPPGNYLDNSVGKSLPGIKLKIAEDGELCMQGPYVSNGFYKTKDSESFKNGWFHSGDIFEKRGNHFFIIDRKKDIYKNSRGQTIAPQKIENLFQDFDSVQSVFLAGDGREFNTVLIYPDKENIPYDLYNMDNQKIRDLFSGMLVSVNSFLSAFERIVNFAIIDRDFSIEKGELTQKGTFNRKNVLKNFSKTIEPMYERNYVSLHSGTKEIWFPNWLIREKGTVKTNLSWDGNKISIKGQDQTLRLIWTDSNLQVGEFKYHTDSQILDLQSFVNSPNLWLGNNEFALFTSETVFRIKEADLTTEIRVKIDSDTFALTKIDKKDNENETNSLEKIHHSVRSYLSNEQSFFDALIHILNLDIFEWSDVILDTLLQYQEHPDPNFRLKMIEAIAPILSGDFFINLLETTYHYYRKNYGKKEFAFDIDRLTESQYRSLILFLNDTHENVNDLEQADFDFIQTVLFMISEYGVIHPTQFILARSELVSWQFSNVPKPIYSAAQKAYYNLVNGFRTWIGPNTSITVDRKTQEEYSWKDVIEFDDNVRTRYKKVLLETLSKTALIREAVFIFSSNCLIQLADIPKDGVWVTHLGTKHGKSVFRVLIHTLTLGTHNLVINLNEDLDRNFLEDEIRWLILMGSGFKDKQLVENFGGYWPEYLLYTEEYIPGETLIQYFKRNKAEIKDETALDRWQMRWLHFIWNGIQAYLEFWSRTNFKLGIQPPIPDNLIIPPHDYTTGTRLISISGRQEIKSVGEYFLNLFTLFIAKTESQFPGLKHMADWELIFTAALQATKVKRGIPLLEELGKDLKNRKLKKQFREIGLTQDRINKFIKEFDNFGVLTKPVVFAALRYERWLDLNPGATDQAKASILRELYNDYNLNSLLEEYPETRVRFFMMTCLKDSGPELTNFFQSIIQEMRRKELSPWSLKDRIEDIQQKTSLTEKEKYFLARMLFPHVDAADYVELVTTAKGDKEKLDLIYGTEGADGQLYRIRPPFHPKEIARFYSLMTKETLSGTFTSSHEFLFIFNSRNRLVGGLYWNTPSDSRIHLEWIIIRNKYRQLQLSKRLMTEFYHRMKQRGIKVITVGFYLESFFYKQGFKIDRHYGGLVKKLN